MPFFHYDNLRANSGRGGASEIKARNICTMRPGLRIRFYFSLFSSGHSYGGYKLQPFVQNNSGNAPVRKLQLLMNAWGAKILEQLYIYVCECVYVTPRGFSPSHYFFLATRQYNLL